MVILKEVYPKIRKISTYKNFLSKKEEKELRNLASKLIGKKIIHLNSTPVGGGVAEILQSLIPLSRSLGVDVRWFAFKAPLPFFRITKRIHNGLQGGRVRFKKDDFQYYLDVNRQLAEQLRKFKFDLLIVHDPQPLAIINFFHLSKMILRLHIDLSEPDQRLLRFLKPYMKMYDRMILSLKAFVPKKFPYKKVVFIPPAIDPLSTKNRALSLPRAKEILTWLGIDVARPIITQVSRFDPWKDPLGVIKAYFIAKQKISRLQLVLAGFRLEKDNPEAQKIYKRALKFAQGDPDIYLLFDLKKYKFSNNEIIGALQTYSDIILQKSLKEGFGLTVAEAMWKSKVVIGGDAAGIRYQIKNGVNGYIVKSPEEAAKIIVKIFNKPALGREIGQGAQRSVREKFLITRYLRDHLKLYQETLSNQLAN